jgi:acyl carrier protein
MPNGKIDRLALRRSPRDPAIGRRPSRPRTRDRGTSLAAIWSELLEIERIGVDDDFFDLGGHSLLAIRAVARVRDQFGVSLRLRNLLDAPTVAGLARVIDALTLLARASAPAQETGDREEIEL